LPHTPTRTATVTYLELALLLTGVGSLVIGYRRNRRGMLVVAAITLLLAGGLGSFVTGVADGWTAAAPTVSR
jgi:CHASE2 domain-containing sensor protein